MADQFSIGSIYGGTNQFGHGNIVNQGDPATAQWVYPAGAASLGGQAAPGAGNRPAASTLYAFADIVGYSQFNERLKADSQERLCRSLDRSLLDAGVEPSAVTWQDQGDARLLEFPRDTDSARVLAALPRFLNDDLRALNRDAAPHAHIRLRLSFAVGPATPGRTGPVGDAPITAVRLGNCALFRAAMKSAARSHCGVIVDDNLYSGYLRTGFRPDMHAEEYLPVQVSDHGKGFEAKAWVRLLGCPLGQARALLG